MKRNSGTGLVTTLLLLFGMVANACAGQSPGFADLAPQTRYFFETGEPLTIEQVSAPQGRDRFQAHEGATLNLGLARRHPLWLHIALPHPTHAHSLFEIAYPLLDHVDLYIPREDGRFERRQTGDAHPFHQRDIDYRNPSFRLPPGVSELYIRVQTSGSLAIPLRLWDEEIFLAHVANTEWVFGAYYGAMLAMLLYNLLLFTFLLDRSYLLYTLSISSVILTLASLNGLTFQHLWPEATSWASRAPPFFTAVGIVCINAFSSHFLRMEEYARQFLIPSRMLMIGGTICALWALFGNITDSIRAVIIVGVLNPLVLLPAGIYVWRKGYVPARGYVYAWTAFLAGITVKGAFLWGLLPTHAGIVSSMEIGSAFEVLLLSMALADRINLIRRNNELAQQAANETLSRLNDRLESVVNQRTAELEEANKHIEATNLELEKQNRLLYQMATHDGLTGLLNRKTFMTRIQTAMEEARRYRLPVAVMMLDLDNFKSINDRYGHQIGDQTLKAVASAIRRQLRDSDLCGRYGGEEFVILLGHASQRDSHPEEIVCATAERLLAAVRALRLSANPALRFSTSIGSTWLHSGERVPIERLIGTADAALYHSKRTGKDRATCWPHDFQTSFEASQNRAGDSGKAASG
ncbi:MAG: diguanylate cyclase [Chromatiales bacterium]|nr:diguanylate cyclase [Chromatiales bacterium]